VILKSHVAIFQCRLDADASDGWSEFSRRSSRSHGDGGALLEVLRRLAPCRAMPDRMGSHDGRGWTKSVSADDRRSVDRHGSLGRKSPGHPSRATDHSIVMLRSPQSTVANFKFGSSCSRRGVPVRRSGSVLALSTFGQRTSTRPSFLPEFLHGSIASLRGFSTWRRRRHGVPSPRARPERGPSMSWEDADG
jgi:hypothetical protein